MYRSSLLRLFRAPQIARAWHALHPKSLHAPYVQPQPAAALKAASTRHGMKQGRERGSLLRLFRAPQIARAWHALHPKSLHAPYVQPQPAAALKAAGCRISAIPPQPIPRPPHQWQLFARHLRRSLPLGLVQAFRKTDFHRVPYGGAPVASHQQK